MAYWIDTNADANGRQTSFYADSDSDITNLPTSSREGVLQNDSDVSNRRVAKGSSVLCLDSGNVYFLNSDDVWKLI